MQIAHLEKRACLHNNSSLACGISTVRFSCITIQSLPVRKLFKDLWPALQREGAQKSCSGGGSFFMTPDTFMMVSDFSMSSPASSYL